MWKQARTHKHTCACTHTHTHTLTKYLHFNCIVCLLSVFVFSTDTYTYNSKDECMLTLIVAWSVVALHGLVWSGLALISFSSRSDEYPCLQRIMGKQVFSVKEDATLLQNKVLSRTKQVIWLSPWKNLWRFPFVSKLNPFGFHVEPFPQRSA